MLQKKKQNKKRKNFYSGLNLILTGILIVSLSLLWRLHYERSLFFNTSEQIKIQDSVNKGYKPVNISIPSVGINLEIKETTIINGAWQVFGSLANHLASSANPNTKGNIVIYGHNKKNIFGPIRWMKVGQVVELIDEKGTKYLYKVDKIVETTPNDIEYVLPKNTETLTLYTCSGLFDRKRFIVIAYPF